jgi:UDP-2,3-diacylglucosamine pyrophosphatase LpxH
MPELGSLHDRLLRALLEAPKVTDVLLVARLEDSRIAYDDATEVRVFIPDLHLLAGKEERKYRYGFNCKEQMIGILKAFKSFRRGLAPHESLTVYQLGDFVDLWRQGSNDATRILQEHYDMYGHLSGSSSALNAWFLLGNHDLDLADHGGFRVWNRRYYFPLRDPRALVLHGDVFDWVERFPEAFKRLFVYLFGPLHDPTAYDFEALQRVVRQAHGGKQYKRHIRAGCHDIADCASAGGSVPDSLYNVARVTDPLDTTAHEFLPAAHRSVEQVKSEFGLRLTTVVIAHTHHARMVVYEGGAGEFLLLMDCGAWIEQYRTPSASEPKPNAQIGVLVGNDCRIYQIV